MENTVVGVVGVDERFHLLEGPELAAYLAGVETAAPTAAPGGMAVDDETAAPATGAGADGGMHVE